MADLDEIKQDRNAVPIARLYDSLKLPPDSSGFPADARCIRVLDILGPCNGDQSSPLEARLRILDLVDKEPFTALSYVWGKDQENRRIFIGDAQVPISANGHSALLHLRKKLGSFTIWVDAICIDQKNEKEKEKQIPLMGEIYSLATPAYMWLGEGDERSDRAMKLLSKTGILDCFLLDVEASKRRRKPLLWQAYWRLTRPWRHGDKIPVPRATAGPRWFGPHWLVQPARLERDQASYEDIDCLLKRAWIRRIWTLQEVLLAKQSVVVCGDSHVPWLRFAWSVIALKDFIRSGVDKDLDLWNTMRPWIATAEACINHHEKQRYKATRSGLASMSLSSRTWNKFIGSADVTYIIASLLVLGLVFLVFGFAFVASTFITLLCWNPALDFIGCTTTTGPIVGIILSVVFSCIPLIYMTSIGLVKERLKPRSLLQLQWVDLILGRDATDPKDKAFGVHSIMQASLDHRLATPDYSLTTEQIYTDFCLTLLSATRSSRFLISAALCPRPDCPTWVPDWSRKPDDFWMSTLMINSARKAFWRHDPSDAKALTVLARRIAIVDDNLTFDASAPAIEPVDSQLLHIANLRKMIRVTKYFPYVNQKPKQWQPTLSSARFMEAIWNTITSSSASPHDRIISREFYLWASILEQMLTKDVESLYRYWLQSSNWLFNLRMLQGRYFDSCLDTRLTNLFRTNVLALNERICSRLARNNLSFISGRGSEDLRWILGTPKIRAGDQTVLIYGSGLFAVRGDNSEARLVGPVAVHRRLRLETSELIQLRLI